MKVTSELLAELSRAQLIELLVTQDKLIRTQNELIDLTASVIGEIRDNA